MTAAVALAALPDALKALPSPETRLAVLAGMGVFLITWSWFWLYALTASWALARVLAIGVLSVLGLLLTIVFPTVDSMVYAVAAAGASFRTRRALVVVVAIT